MHRRDFIQTAAGAIGAGSLGTSVPHLPHLTRFAGAGMSLPDILDAAAFRDSRRFVETRFGRIAYIERGDYAQGNLRYQTLDGETGELVESVPTAFKNAATGQYYSAQGFQLISAGPDGRFGTEDDVTAFDRE